MNTSKYQFDGFMIDLEEKRLEREGKTVSIQPRVFDLLVFLVKHHGELVSRDDLMSAVWADTFVEETNLRFCIHSLRKTLGKNSDGKDYIETIPKRGHRFIADVREVSLSGPAADAELEVSRSSNRSRHSLPAKGTWLVGGAFMLLAGIAVIAFAWKSGTTASPKNALGINRLAVLPFQTVSESEKNLQSGILASLITNLNKIKALNVTPIGSVRKFAGTDFDSLDAGNQLGADVVLTGSYRVDGDLVIVTATLLRVTNNLKIWTEDFAVSGKSDIDREISIGVRAARLISLKLANAEDEKLLSNQNLDKEAVQSYLAARNIWRRNELDRREEMFGLFEKVIVLEPGWAAAYAGYSEALLSSEEFAEEESKIKQIAEKSIQLDKSLPQPHAVLGEASRWFDWNWKEAEAQLKLAIGLDPDYALSYYKYARLLLVQRRFGEAEIQLKKAIDLEPFSPLFHAGLCELYSADNKIEDAISACRYAQQIEPGFWQAQKLLFWIYVKNRMFNELDELLFAKMSSEEKAKTPLAIAVSKKDLRPYWLITISEPVTNEQPVSDASFYLQIGEKEKALDKLEIALKNRDLGLPSANVGLAFDSIREHPPFKQIMRKIGLSN